MRHRTTAALLLMLLATALPGLHPAVAARSAPVRVEYEHLRSVHVGDEVPMTLTFRALATVDQVDVWVAADEGLEVVSTPAEATFRNVRNGEARTFTVTLRFTDPKAGVLAVFFKTRRGEIVESGTTGIVIAVGRD